MNVPSNEELVRLRDIAEQGRRAPLLGGWHLMLWGGAMTVALLINWAVIEKILEWPGYGLAISWFGITLGAWAVSILLGRNQALSPGAHSVGNQVEKAVWTTAGLFLLILAVAIFVRGSLSGDPQAWSLFTIMSPVMFGVYAVALHASAVASHSNISKPYVLVALAFAAATALSIGSSTQYLLAAAGVALVSIVPAVGHLNAARKAS